MSSPDGPGADSLDQAIRRFKAAAIDLQESHGDLESRVHSLEQQLQDAHLRLEVALEAIGFGAAVLARDGSVLVANERLVGLKLGEAGGRVAGPLRDLVSGTLKEGGATAHLSWDSPDCPTPPLDAKLVALGDAEETRLLIVQQRDRPPEEPLSAALDEDD